MEFSLLRRLPETGGLLAAARELGVTLLAYSPLAMGRLTGKYSAANPPKARIPPLGVDCFPIWVVSRCVRQIPWTW